MPRSTASGGKCVARYISPTNKLGKSLNCQERILQRILSGVSLVLVSIFGRIYKIPRLLDGTHFRCEVLQITEGRKVKVFAPARKISCPPEYFSHRLCDGEVPAQPAAHRPESRPVGEAQFVPEIGEQNLVDLSDNQCSVSIVIFPLYLLQNRCRLDIPSENVTKLKPIRRRKAAMKYFVQKL